MKMNRKYIAVAFCVMGLGGQIDILIRDHALIPVPWGRLLFGACSGLLLPGGIVMILIRDVTGMALPFAVMVYLSAAFWFFPLNRVRRWFGTFDAVGDTGKRRLPSLSRGAAAVLDTLARLRVGKGKMGGWS